MTAPVGSQFPIILVNLFLDTNTFELYVDTGGGLSINKGYLGPSDTDDTVGLDICDDLDPVNTNVCVDLFLISQGFFEIANFVS